MKSLHRVGSFLGGASGFALKSLAWRKNLAAARKIPGQRHLQTSELNSLIRGLANSFAFRFHIHDLNWNGPITNAGDGITDGVKSSPLHKAEK